MKHSSNIRLFIVLSVFLFAGSLPAEPSDETLSMVVTTSEDVVNDADGLTFLHEANAYAGTVSPGTNITFDAGVFATEQTMKSVSARTLDRSLNIGGTITVNGVQIKAVAAGDTVTLSNLILQNGYTTISRGGAIFNSVTLAVFRPIPDRFAGVDVMDHSPRGVPRG